MVQVFPGVAQNVDLGQHWRCAELLRGFKKAKMVLPLLPCRLVEEG
ncbi:hypothetical protein CpipJ_CPIJ001592 [Culex quinquefasciatus]|uniref:Uncharacterized protein n=1 Tax=Culex quinquefasciatus TaxID=7176 RepID=B0W2Z2_CULQU|nr:hypothetical protein CpipJ_CPIJ001592 [Culex quinquefasciatus]|eukprot:XP_001843076.1 hypothetical protein CpipJ_CPIJ001592 [Culex quinquefasciatus]